MVKYAAAIPRESILEIEGLLTCPDAAITSCSQQEVRGPAPPGLRPGGAAALAAHAPARPGTGRADAAHAAAALVP
jgi:hypothetical protein